MFNLRHTALTIALTMLAFSVGLATGSALAVQPAPSVLHVPAMIGGTPATGPVNLPRCSSTEGPEDYETCKLYFGD